MTFKIISLALLASVMAGAAISVAPAQTDYRSVGQPRTDATEADRKIFAAGLRQFSRAWDEH